MSYLPRHHTCPASQRQGQQWPVFWGQQTGEGASSRGFCLGAWLVLSPPPVGSHRLAVAADAEAAATTTRDATSLAAR